MMNSIAIKTSVAYQYAEKRVSHQPGWIFSHAIHHDHRALHDRIVQDETSRSPDGFQAFFREDLKSWEWERRVARKKLSGLRIIAKKRMRAT
jgi:hypothetical protein